MDGLKKYPTEEIIEELEKRGAVRVTTSGYGEYKLVRKYPDKYEIPDDEIYRDILILPIAW